MRTTSILLLLAAASIASCGSKPSASDNDATTDSTTVTTDSAATEVPVAATPAFTAEGIGPVKLQAAIKSLPKQVDGLYDKVDISTDHNDMEDEDVTTATFSLNGQQMFGAMAGEDGTIFYISTDNSAIRIDINGTGAGVGSSLKDLLKLKGVKTDSEFAARWGDVWFNADANGIITDFGIGGW